MVSKPFLSDFAGPLRRPNVPPGTIPNGFGNMALRNKGFKQRQRPDSSRFCGVLPDRANGDMELFAAAPISLGSRA
jgi:hypothetical protein